MVFAEHVVLGDECMRSQTKKQIGRWALLSFLLTLVVGVLYSAVTLPPASGQVNSADSALLTKQLEFMLKMNTAFLGFLGTVGVLLTWFFKNNLDDAKEVAGDIVRRELEGKIKTLAEQEFTVLRRAILPERIVSQTSVAYFLPNATVGIDDISEIRLLEVRGFRQPIRFCTSEKKLRSLNETITILDLQNMELSTGQKLSELPKEERESYAEQLITRLFEKVLPKTAVLVVYFRGYISVLNSIKPKSDTQYLLPANNPVTLLGHTANGAYAAYGEHT